MDNNNEGNCDIQIQSSHSILLINCALSNPGLRHTADDAHILGYTCHEAENFKIDVLKTNYIHRKSVHMIHILR